MGKYLFQIWSALNVIEVIAPFYELSDQPSYVQYRALPANIMS